jgi:hypothetical protein
MNSRSDSIMKPSAAGLFLGGLCPVIASVSVVL